jgi:CHAT domain-containing protein
MIQFHQLLKQSLPSAKALNEAQQWLRDLTYEKLIEWYQNQADRLAKIDPDGGTLETLRMAIKMAQKKANNLGADHLPYAHPFHWAGFTITGKVPTE